MSRFPPKFLDFSIREMKSHPEKIREWARQDENPLLKTLANDVIEAAGVAE